MTKNEFMCILRSNLNNFSTKEVSEILYDYEEHFNIGMAKGKSESEVIEELGDPESIAKQYSSNVASSENDCDSAYKSTSTQNQGFSNHDISNNSNSSDKLLTIILLILLIIFGSGPILGVFGTIIGFLCAGIGIIIGGLSMLITGATGVMPSIFGFLSLSRLAIMSIPAFILAALGLIALGGLFLVGNVWLIKFGVKCIMKLFYWFKERLA